MTNFNNVRKVGPSTFSLTKLDWAMDFTNDKAQGWEHFRNARVLPALMVLLNNITLVRNSDNKVSTSATLDALRARVGAGDFTFNGGEVIDAATMGAIFTFLRYPSRGIMLSGVQRLPTNIRFAGNVPLFMSAFKQYRDVDYSDWDFMDPKMNFVVDPLNLELLRFSGTEIGWSNDDLLQFATAMYTNAGGKNPGSISAITGYFHKKTGDEAFDAMPRYVRMLLCQVWLFQPIYDNKFGIRNLQDIDAPAIPLIDTELFKPVAKKEKIKLKEEPAWEW